jgi:hypothetical protein
LRINRLLQTGALLAMLLLSGNLFFSLAQHKDPQVRSALADARATGGATSQEATGKELNEFGVWGGGSWISARVAGVARDTKLGLIGLRYARVLSSGKVAILKYTVDVIPFAILSYPKSEPVQTATGPFIERTAVRAAGSAPIGLQVNFRPERRVQPFANVSGGCLYFARQIPNSLGTQFNFTADLGGGIQIKTRSHRAVTLGYRLHHISNAELGDTNPGYDSNLFYIGFSFFR